MLRGHVLMQMFNWVYRQLVSICIFHLLLQTDILLQTSFSAALDLVTLLKYRLLNRLQNASYPNEIT